MKKKNLLLLTVATGLLLVGCGRSTPTSSTVSTSDVSSVSSVSVGNSSEETKASSINSSSNTQNSSTSIKESSISSEEFVIPTVISDQTDWTTDDIEFVEYIVDEEGVNIPYLKNYIYDLNVDPNDDYCAYFTVATTSELYSEYVKTLKALYPNFTTETATTGEVFIAFEDTVHNLYIEVVDFEEDGHYYVQIAIYPPYDDVDDGEDIEVSDYALFASGLGLSSAYPTSKGTATVNDVSYEYSKFVGGAQSTGYKDFDSLPFQFKSSSSASGESGKGYIRNTSALPATRTVTVYVLSTYDTPKIPTIYGSNSEITASSTSEQKGTAKVGTGISTGNYSSNSEIKLYPVTFTFTEEVKYFKIVNDNTNALYIQCIDLAPEAGNDDSGDDDGGNTEKEATKKVDLSKATYADKSSLGDYEYSISSTGSQKVLVVPVDFSDYQASTLGYSIEALEKAFNTGTRDELDYINVKDYFAQSSYGKLNVEFDIYDSWVRGNKSFADYQSQEKSMDQWGDSGEDSYATNEQVILNDVLAYLDSQGVDLSQYDTDNNGTIDAIVLVYSAPIDESEEETEYEKLGWAWRYWNYLANPADGSADEGYKPYLYDGVCANDYLWASYQFLFEGIDEEGYTQFTYTDHLNTYTFIHEFSHVLGADDYYDTTGNQKADCINGHDIMDQYSGDHNAYTKFNYGWITETTLVQGETSVTLRDFETYGDTIVISNSWSDSKGCYQEYWVLQYYTNTGLNADEDNEYVGLFEDEGIVTYHIDSTLAYDEEYECYYIKNNNSTYTGGENSGSKDPLIEIVKTTSGSYVLTSDDTSSATAKDNKGKKIPFTYTVTENEDGTVTVTFTKNA